jgi:hypothetical protein
MEILAFQQLLTFFKACYFIKSNPNYMLSADILLSETFCIQMIDEQIKKKNYKKMKTGSKGRPRLKLSYL